MARINPNKVNILIENPKADMTASVPIRETGMVMQGMITARKFWRNRKITSMTRAVVSRKVTSTFVDGGIDYLCRVQCHIINDSFR